MPRVKMIHPVNAETAYQQVLDIDTEYAQAYLRLGMVYEARRMLTEVRAALVEETGKDGG